MATNWFIQPTTISVVKIINVFFKLCLELLSPLDLYFQWSVDYIIHV